MRIQPILLLSLDGVFFKAGGKQLIKNLSYQFKVGPRSVIVGPNGAGKSLLLRLCHRLLEPSQGHIQWHGEAEDKSDATFYQAMVFQRPVMLRRTVSANIEYALSLRGLNKAQRRARIEDVLELTGLAHLAHFPARVLSFGEQQKLALARAWALRPKLLFLDEPTASLDPAATYAIEEVINAIHRSGTQIIMTTHDLPQAQRLADEVLFIHQGRLLESGPAAAFFAGPTNQFARAFLKGDLLLWDRLENKGKLI
jgi:tungstate transport system ATP-binding protein